MKIVTHDPQGGSTVVDYGGPMPKSVYTKAEFISKIPKNKLKAIQAAMSTNDDINFWVFQMQMHQGLIDLNDLPPWFTEGIDAMVAEGIVTQVQADNFLER